MVPANPQVKLGPMSDAGTRGSACFPDAIRLFLIPSNSCHLDRDFLTIGSAKSHEGVRNRLDRLIKCDVTSLRGAVYLPERTGSMPLRDVSTAGQSPNKQPICHAAADCTRFNLLCVGLAFPSHGSQAAAKKRTIERRKMPMQIGSPHRQTFNIVL